MEYRLCEAKTAKKLERTVNQLLKAGWRSTGGVSVAQSNNTSHWWYYQAVVRDEEATLAATSRSAEYAKPPANGFGDLE